MATPRTRRGQWTEQLLRRRCTWVLLFIGPLPAVLALTAVFKDYPYIPLGMMLCCSVFGYLQARYLGLSSPELVALAAFVGSIFTMIYMVGYAHGRGVSYADPTAACNPTDGPDAAGDSEGREE